MSGTTSVELPFGRGSVSVAIPSGNLIGIFAPRELGQAAVDEQPLSAVPWTTPSARPACGTWRGAGRRSPSSPAT